jgi:replication factor C small subunit
MSEAETAADATGRDEIWIEKYRPETLDEVAGHDDVIDRIERYVADGDLPNMLFAGPAGTGKTTTAVAIARELYGEAWDEHFLELNASDERGIDVVRDRIKNFARSAFGGDAGFRIIFLDESDSLTSDAQAALRRTMEQFADNVRFILSCNYSNQLIDPIQSRCAVFRFGPLDDDAVAGRARQVAESEGIDLTDGGVEALVHAADGDMRTALNVLQAASLTADPVDEAAVYAVAGVARPEEIRAMAEAAVAGDFAGARATLDDLLDAGLAAGDVIDQLHRAVWDLDVSEAEAVAIMERLGEADYRITIGADERLQMEALLASLTLRGGDQ